MASITLGYSMLDKLLFSLVRTDHGAACSAWARAYGVGGAGVVHNRNLQQ